MIRREEEQEEQWRGRQRAGENPDRVAERLLPRFGAEHVARLDIREQIAGVAPIENCVILLSDPVGVQDVSAIEFVQITVRTKMSGSASKARKTGTPKKMCVSQTPSRLRTGTPTKESESGSSMCLSTSVRGASAFFLPRRFLKALVKISGLPASAINDPTTIIVTPHQSDH